MKYLLMLLSLLSFASCWPNKDEVIYVDAASKDSLITSEENSQVTREFGALQVRVGEYTAKAKFVPWSSWWFPTKDKFLFEHKDPEKLAPLQKYDLYVEKVSGDDPSSAQFEEMELYDADEVNWAGLCHAWAIASVLHPEPKIEVVRKKIKFSVSDQKALLLKSYENVQDLKIYGRRYNGNFSDEFEDIYPDQFHRFAQVFLFEKNIPFLMDYDASFPVWTVPVYETKFKIVKIDQETAEVKSWVTSASSFVEDPNFVGSKKSVKYYEYRLRGQWIGDVLHVTGSEWTGDSIHDHPDFLIANPKGVKRASSNTKLRLEYIDQIIGIF